MSEEQKPCVTKEEAEGMRENALSSLKMMRAHKKELKQGKKGAKRAHIHSVVETLTGNLERLSPDSPLVKKGRDFLASTDTPKCINPSSKPSNP